MDVESDEAAFDITGEEISEGQVGTESGSLNAYGSPVARPQNVSVMYQSNRSFNIPPRATPGHLYFLQNFFFKFPPPEAEKLFKCPIIGPFQVIKCPHPRETFR